MFLRYPTQAHTQRSPAVLAALRRHTLAQCVYTGYFPCALHSVQWYTGTHKTLPVCRSVDVGANGWGVLFARATPSVRSSVLRIKCGSMLPQCKSGVSARVRDSRAKML